MRDTRAPLPPYLVVLYVVSMAGIVSSAGTGALAFNVYSGVVDMLQRAQVRACSAPERRLWNFELRPDDGLAVDGLVVLPACLWPVATAGAALAVRSAFL